MNKDMTLFFRVTDNNTGMVCHEVSSALKMLCEDEYEIIIFRFLTCETTIKNKFIKDIVETEKTWQENHIVYIKNIISCTPNQLRSTSLYLLSKYGFSISLQIENTSGIINAKKKVKKIKRLIHDFEISLNCPIDFNTYEFFENIPFPIRLESLNRFNDAYTALFAKWLISSNNTEILNFTEVMKTIMLNEHLDCEYHSCLGRILSVDASGLSFWCRYNRPETELNQMCSAASLAELFNEGVFEDYLDAHINKREFCKGSCSKFEMCQGGCPLQCSLKTGENEMCTEQKYLCILEHITIVIKRILSSGDLSVLNKHARAIVLKTLAFAPFSEIFQNISTHNGKVN